jgi:hypothetical protein
LNFVLGASLSALVAVFQQKSAVLAADPPLIFCPFVIFLAFPVLSLLTVPVTTISSLPDEQDPWFFRVKPKLILVTPLFAHLTEPAELLSLPLNAPVPPVVPLVHPENVPVADSDAMFTVPLSDVHVAASVAFGTAALAAVAVSATAAADTGISSAAGTKSALATFLPNIYLPPYV